ncbi:MAG: secondary thiamine-phosphate synthase enzyme YjbQ [Gammaproteobacteria bacterium]|nr:secondary thiamine-phosphate synthase enzyme YjbQ [Gammaproteobacteria bacterium]MDH5735784.1 secondary thiamine-phosphate synthase enzyme YjbQ [Gammaproteobacteria bacterium]
MKIINHDLEINTRQGFSLFDVTMKIRQWLKDNQAVNGNISITSQHTTTAVVINEFESRLLEDIKTFFLKLAPENSQYLHNDIELRDCPADEPENAHSHLIAMMMGSSESIPVIDGDLKLGQYQSVILVELDGPRQRKLAIQFMGE